MNKLSIIGIAILLFSAIVYSSDFKIQDASNNIFFFVNGTSGNVGVNTDNPNATLHVSGNVSVSKELKVGTTAQTCTTALEGAIRYDSTGKNLNYCNSTDWTVAGTSSGGPSLEISFSSNQTLFNETGGNATLTWSTNGFTSCNGVGDWSGSKSTSGSEVVEILDEFSLTPNKNYDLSCSVNDTLMGFNGSINLSEEIEFIPSTCTAGKLIVNYTGSNQTFNFGPCTNINITMWGGGGGAGHLYSGAYGAGSGSVYYRTSIPTGTTLNVLVGGGGEYATDRCYGSQGGWPNGGSVTGSPCGGGGGGGGRSEVLIDSTTLLVAGGGGGGGYAGWTGKDGTGGEAGGTSGTAGASPDGGGGGGGGSGSGGTAGSAGSGGSAGSAGSSRQGGTGAAGTGGDGRGGGGGGDGYYGGGGGGSTSSAEGGGGGGGGSSYANSGYSGYVTHTHYSASTTTPGNSGDSDRGGYGDGGSGTVGDDGRVVIYYG